MVTRVASGTLEHLAVDDDDERGNHVRWPDEEEFSSGKKKAKLDQDED